MLQQTLDDDLSRRLQSSPKPDHSTFKPLILSGAGEESQQSLKKLISEQQPVLHDEYRGQLKELLKIRYPETKLDDQALEELCKEKYGSLDLAREGNYVYYPWSNRLVHLLKEEDFIELRTSRNKYKITAEEQQLLATRVVGVVGLSVGQSVALTIATERIAGTLRLADFDVLELSNLNRIRTGVQNLGVAKSVAVAREIAEIDPYLNVELFPEGLTEANMKDYLEGGSGKMDLLLEECDSLPIKIKVREEARRRQIPVVMDTSDRGMIDIERFDLEPERSLLHGKAVESADELKSLTPEQQRELLIRMVDFAQTSARLKQSYAEIGKSLTTWPQLASDVVAGGGVAAKVSRLILLGHEVRSGRYYHDLPNDMIQNN